MPNTRPAASTLLLGLGICFNAALGSDDALRVTGVVCGKAPGGTRLCRLRGAARPRRWEPGVTCDSMVAASHPRTYGRPATDRQSNYLFFLCLSHHRLFWGK